MKIVHLSLDHFETGVRCSVEYSDGAHRDYRIPWVITSGMGKAHGRYINEPVLSTPYTPLSHEECVEIISSALARVDDLVHSNDQKYVRLILENRLRELI